jgi:hypothetical protein
MMAAWAIRGVVDLAIAMSGGQRAGRAAMSTPLAM